MGLYLLHLHLHGLFRGENLELGRDPDTGGQTTYVLELVRGLAARPELERVEVITRRIQERRVASDYGLVVESIGPRATIRRLPFGPKRYLRKELLWPHLDELADALAEDLLHQPRLPDWIHAHYADAGYVGALLHRRLGVPLVFTAHSLGREKRRRLIAAGLDPLQIEQQFAMERRIDAEELALAHCQLVVTSTEQEATGQYARYGHFHPELAQVIPPGVDALAFHPRPPPTAPGNEEQASDAADDAEDADVAALMAPFLREPERPPVLAICRADHRKNIPALIEVFGRSELLRRRHNLVLVLGCREDPRQLEKQQRELFQQVFERIDRFDLYGVVAYPKQHRRHQVPAIYRWAAQRRGVFVNPALTEPFGLTLLEAAACGLPLVATDDGGPRDILARCANGLLVDVSDLDALQEAVETAASDPVRWQQWSDRGIRAIRRHYTWDAHVSRYLAAAGAMAQAPLPLRLPLWFPRPAPSQLQASPLGECLLLLDLDGFEADTDVDGLDQLRRRMVEDPRLGIGLVSGRSFESVQRRAHDLQLIGITLWITESGTEIHTSEAGEWRHDATWRDQIGRRWNRQGVEDAMAALAPRLRLQGPAEQGAYKVSYHLQEPVQGLLPLVRQQLRSLRLAARPHLFRGWYLDVLPLTASKAEAMRYAALRWALPLNRILVAARQQGDGEVLRGLPLGVVPVNHDPELEALRGHRRIFFSSRPNLWGVLEGLEHHRLIGR